MLKGLKDARDKEGPLCVIIGRDHFGGHFGLKVIVADKGSVLLGLGVGKSERTRRYHELSHQLQRELCHFR